VSGLKRYETISFFKKGGGGQYECAQLKNKNVEPVLTGKIPKRKLPPEKNQSVSSFGTSNRTRKVQLCKNPNLICKVRACK